jgi:DNA excision repair protein ERCC-4
MAKEAPPPPPYDACSPSPYFAHTRLPNYLAQAFGDLYQQDGLFVCGRGLGLLHLLAAFCRFYVDVKEGHAALVLEELERELESNPQDQQPHVRRWKHTLETKQSKPLVFVIGLKDHERHTLISILQAWGTPSELLPTEITNEAGQAKDRSLLYARGGVFLVTSRILIVDLLTHHAAPEAIAGILVAHGEQVTETSTEAFIIRIYKTHKRWGPGASSLTNDSTSNSSTSAEANAVLQTLEHGFIKAFSEHPEKLMQGFAKVDKVMKALFLQKLYIYPRFHTAISKELEQAPPVVEELHQVLTPRMKMIQNCIAVAVKTCIREIQKATNLIDWSEEDLTLENCATVHFDITISNQLQSDWHRLKPTTKQLVHDLKTLRTLFHYLIQYDCFSFWKLLNNIKSMSASARFPSLWLLTPAADRMFAAAKERMYSLTEQVSSKTSKVVTSLVPTLEENPKWRLLQQVLSEIEVKEKNKANAKRPSQTTPTTSFGLGARILVMVKEERTLDAVRSYLVEGSNITMTKRWIRYLQQVNDRSRSLARGAGGSSHLSTETRLLLEEEGRARNYLYGPGGVLEYIPSPSPIDTRKRGEVPVLNAVPDWKRKRRRINEERTRGESNMQEDDRERKTALDEAVEETEYYDTTLLSKESTNTFPQEDEEGDSSSDEEDERCYKVSEQNELNVMIRTYSSTEGEAAYLLLNDVRPTHVVLYDVESSFIRSLEIHSASCSDQNKDKSDPLLHVYFMMFESSSEEKNYLRALEREQNAFERLIQHRKTMPLPVNTMGPSSTQEMQLAGGGSGGSYNNGSLPLSMDTRSANRGRLRKDQDRRDIAVDVREFRSALPSILHQGGMRIAPVTLTVGDFVLSTVHCVERKSISDLFGSFASGRLYTQAESMCKHYKVPCLLIEFDPAKTFCLQNVNEIGPDIRSDKICSKMALLVMHFPKLRLLWSRSPFETLKLFKALKTNHEEVDVERAVEIGSNESLDAVLSADVNGDTEEIEVNEAARDFLLRLPGVNIHNARKIMKSCKSLVELTSLTREEMKELMGPQPGQKLFSFLNQKVD